MAKPEILQPFILSWEGGFANDPDDKGGATNKGVTIATYRHVFGQHKTVDDLKHITDREWLTIFRRYFWDKWKADQIKDQSIANLLVDWTWTSGKYGITIPQKALSLTADGIVGPKTLRAINSYPDQKELFTYLWKQRQAYFKRIATGQQRKFLKGWLNRLNGIQYGRLVQNGGRVVTF